MKGLLYLSNLLSRFVAAIGRVASWAVVILVLVTVFDVVTRRLFVVGSTKLQDLEWQLHTVLFMFCMGYAYIKDSHVRIDLLRTRFTAKTKQWVELFGCMVFFIPFCALILFFSVGWWYRSFSINEAAASATGLPHLWIIKSAMPLGFLVLLLSGIAKSLECIVFLSGKTSAMQQSVNGRTGPGANSSITRK